MCIKEAGSTRICDGSQTMGGRVRGCVRSRRESEEKWPRRDASSSEGGDGGDGGGGRGGGDWISQDTSIALDAAMTN